MKEIIVKNFPNTEDAVLVDRWFSHYLPGEGTEDFIRKLLLETIPDWQGKILAEAERIEAEAQEKRRKDKCNEPR